MLPFEVVRIIMLVLDIYTWVIIAAAVISWVTPNPYNPAVRLLRDRGGVERPFLLGQPCARGDQLGAKRPLSLAWTATGTRHAKSSAASAEK